jgi:hypothetical protein
VLDDGAIAFDGSLGGAERAYLQSVVTIAAAERLESYT